MTQKFKTGDEVRFTYDDEGLWPSAKEWKDGNKKGRGKITNYFQGHQFDYHVDIDGGIPWNFAEKALRPAKPVQKFQEGEEVEFTYDDGGFLPSGRKWMDGNKTGTGKYVIAGAIGTRAQAPIQTSQQAGPRSEREFPARHLCVVVRYDLSFHKASAEMHRS